MASIEERKARIQAAKEIRLEKAAMRVSRSSVASSPVVDGSVSSSPHNTNNTSSGSVESSSSGRPAPSSATTSSPNSRSLLRLSHHAVVNIPPSPPSAKVTGTSSDGTVIHMAAPEVTVIREVEEVNPIVERGREGDQEGHRESSQEPFSSRSHQVTVIPTTATPAAFLEAKSLLQEIQSFVSTHAKSGSRDEGVVVQQHERGGPAGTRTVASPLVNISRSAANTEDEEIDSAMAAHSPERRGGYLQQAETQSDRNYQRRRKSSSSSSSSGELEEKIQGHHRVLVEENEQLKKQLERLIAQSATKKEQPNPNTGRRADEEEAKDDEVRHVLDFDKGDGSPQSSSPPVAVLQGTEHDLANSASLHRDGSIAANNISSPEDRQRSSESPAAEVVVATPENLSTIDGSAANSPEREDTTNPKTHDGGGRDATTSQQASSSTTAEPWLSRDYLRDYVSYRKKHYNEEMSGSTPIGNSSSKKKSTSPDQADQKNLKTPPAADRQVPPSSSSATAATTTPLRFSSSGTYMLFSTPNTRASNNGVGGIAASPSTAGTATTTTTPPNTAGLSSSARKAYTTGSTRKLQRLLRT